MKTRTSSRRGPHKVGLTAVALGLPLALLLPFATVAKSRIQTGRGVSALSGLGAAEVALLVLPWIALAALSATGSRATLAAASRGLVASSVAPLYLLLLDRAAPGLLARAGAGSFGRVSIGAGIWVAGFMAYAVVLASRRELGGTRLVAGAVAAAMPAAVVALLLLHGLDHLGVVAEYRNIAGRYWREALVHVELAAVAIGVATLLGVSAGVLAYFRPRSRRPVFTVLNLFQTVPGLAMIGLLVAPFGAIANRLPVLRQLGIGGLGWAPVVFALVLYGLLPVARNTYAGLEAVPRATLEAGTGMGMTRAQLLSRVHLPLASPVVFSGVRTSAEQTVGTAVLGAFAAAGGLGLFVFQGLSQQSTDLILLGAVGIMVLAVTVDAFMRGAERLFAGSRHRRGTER